MFQISDELRKFVSTQIYGKSKIYFLSLAIYEGWACMPARVMAGVVADGKFEKNALKCH